MVFVGLVAIAVLVYLLVAFFVQFYGQAIVIDGASAIASFKRSYRVVRTNLLATVGYTLLAMVIGALGGGVSLLARPESTSVSGLPTLSVPLLIVVGLLAAVIGSVVSTFMLTFPVAVYDEFTTT
ncbi:hypothetical protein JCM17092_25890 [Haloplanus litoreus]